MAGAGGFVGVHVCARAQQLYLADNKIAGGLEALANAHVDALTTLDLSNNRIATVATLEPLVREATMSARREPRPHPGSSHSTHANVLRARARARPLRQGYRPSHGWTCWSVK